MLTRTSEYALRALIHLAQHEDDWPLTGRCIAEQAKIPRKYLSKVLGDLVRVGVLESSPGRTGGFRLRRAAKKTALMDVLAPFEQFNQQSCPFGNRRCDDDNPCNAHDQWKKVVETKQRFLKKTTIYDIAMRMSHGRGKRRGKR